VVALVGGFFLEELRERKYACGGRFMRKMLGVGSSLWSGEGSDV